MKYISKVLLYNVDENRLSLIKHFFDENNITYVNVDKKDYHQTIASLLKLEAFDLNIQSNMEKLFEDEMAILYNFDDKLLNNFLNYFKDNKIPSIALKAIFTPTNAKWTSFELYQELIKEAKFFKNKNK